MTDAVISKSNQLKNSRDHIYIIYLNNLTNKTHLKSNPEKLVKEIYDHTNGQAKLSTIYSIKVKLNPFVTIISF